MNYRSWFPLLTMHIGFVLGTVVVIVVLVLTGSAMRSDQQWIPLLLELVGLVVGGGLGALFGVKHENKRTN